MAASDKAATATGTGLRVLVVEDEVMISMLVEDMLAELGHHVFAFAVSLEEAGELASTGDFDAALLDVNLNGQKVDAVAETLVRRGKPFVFTTGYGERGVPKGYQDRPMLPKPYQIEQLAQALASAVRSSR